MRTWFHRALLCSALALFGTTIAFGQSAPSITTQPQSQSIAAGSNAVFTVVAGGQTPLSYQWSHGGANLTDGGHTFGSTNSSLTVAMALLADAGSYRVVVTNRHGTATSANAVLNVILPPMVTGIANQRMFPNGSPRALAFNVTDLQNANLTVTATSSDLNVIPSANLALTGTGTNRTLTVTPAGAVGSSIITIQVQNSYGLSASTNFNVNVGGFSEIASGIAPLADGKIQWVDFDNDGKLDLFNYGRDQSYTFHSTVYRNNGNGTFSTNSNEVPSALDWADFDNDGFADMLAGGAIYRNNHDGTFTQVQTLPVASVNAAAWGDFNNDGRPDIAFTDYNGGSVLRNNGNGTFTDMNVPLAHAVFGTIAWADINNDGLMDTILAGNVNNVFETHVYANNGNGTFQEIAMSLPGISGANGIAWGDYNGDGKIDLLISGSSGGWDQGKSQIWRNDSTPGTPFMLSNISAPMPGLNSSATAWGDFDNDGRLDCFVGGLRTDGFNYFSGIFRNNGADAFANSGIGLTAIYDGGASWGDYDGDGALDLAISGYTYNSEVISKIYHNDGAMPNTPPTVPSGLTAVVTNNGVILTWNAGTDAEQIGGLNYNLRIGTASGAIDIVSPIANVNTGVRRIPKIGNAGYRLTQTITNLPNGTVYWSVQSIDNSFAGSPFASEQTFQVDFRSPTVTIQPQAQTLLVGSNATMNLTADGTTPMVFQWFHDGAPIAGATGSTLTLTKVQGWQSGQYSVAATNLAGSSVSSPVSLTVVTQAVGLINIDFGASTRYPHIKVGPAAVGIGTNDYWNFYDRDYGIGGTPQNSGSLSGLSLSSGQNTGTRVIMEITNSAGGFTFGQLDPMYGSFLYSLTSDPLEVTFRNMAVGTFDFYIYGHEPRDESSSTYELFVDGVSYGTLSTAADHQWASSNWIEGAQFVAFRGVQINASTANVKITVTGADTATPENNVYPHGVLAGIQIAQISATTVPPTMWWPPLSRTIPIGDPVLFHSLYTGTAPLSYQWLFNGTPIVDGSYYSGANEPNLLVTNTPSALAGSYSVVVSNISATVTSSAAVLTVVVVPPAFTAQPASTAIGVGSNAVFTVTETGTAPLTNHWFFNGNSLTDGGNIVGSATTALTVSNVQASDGGSYYVMASNEVGSTNSDIATLTVGYPPVVTTSPLSQTNIQGSNVVFTGEATGTQPLSYLWTLNGIALSEDSRRIGTTSATLTVSNLIAGDAGNYILWISNQFGLTSSLPAALTVIVPPTVNTQPIGRSVPPGLPTAFSVGVSGTAPISYQWRLNGVDIPGANAASYTVASVTADQLGSYSVVVTNTAGMTNSRDAVLTFGPVAAWGYNVNNQCLPPPGLSNVVAVGATQTGSYALGTDGSLIRWGNSTNNGIKATDIVSFSVAYNDLGVALRADGSVSGINRTVSTAWTNMVGVAASTTTSYALRSDGTVVSSSQFVPGGLINVVALSASATQVMALRNDGTVAVWSETGTYVTPPVVLTNIVAVECGFSCSFAVKSDGRIIAWGNSSLTNVPAAATNVVAISVSDYPNAPTGFAAALRADGTLVSWGTSFTLPTNVIAPSAISNVVAVNAAFHGLAMVNNGAPQFVRVPVGGTAYTGNDFALRAVAVGANLDYQWSRNGTPIVGGTSPALVLTNIQFADAGSYQLTLSNAVGSVTSLAVPVNVINSSPRSSTAQLFQSPPIAYVGGPVTLGTPISGSKPMSIQWRYHATATSGISTNLPGATNDILTLDPVYATNAGWYTVQASNAFGTYTSPLLSLTVRQVVAWGDNTYNKTNVPTSLTNAIAVSGGNYYNMSALRDDGSVLMWGFNGTSNAPLGGTNIVEISSAYGTSTSSLLFGLRTNGTVWSTLGPSTYSNAVANLSNIVAMETDAGGSTFLKPDGNIVRITGNGTNVLSGISNVIALSQWDDGFQALRADGTIFNAGSGGPAPVVTNVVSIASSRYAGTFLRRDQTIYDWGRGVGINPLTNNYLAVAATFQGTELGVRTDGSISAWGATGPATNVPAGLPRLRVIDGGYGGFIALCTPQDFDSTFLHTALNTSNIVVSSRTAAQWYPQHAVTHDGVSAARSATIGGNTASSMRTLITNGPVNVGFWWKVSSQTNHDFLTFSIGGVAQASISGEVDWQRVSFNVPAGPHMLVWTYSKDAAGTSGQDAGWVDQFVIGAQPPFITAQPQSQTVLGGSTATFSVGASGQAPLHYTWYRNNTTQLGAKGEGTNTFTLPNAHRFYSASYSVVITNALGSVTSSNAVLTVRTPQEIQTPVLLPDGTFQISSGDVDNASFSSTMSVTNFHPQYSSNLIDWVQLDTTLSISNGLIYFNDTDATNAPLRFYRVIEGW